MSSTRQQIQLARQISLLIESQHARSIRNMRPEVNGTKLHRPESHYNRVSRLHASLEASVERLATLFLVYLEHPDRRECHHVLRCAKLSLRYAVHLSDATHVHAHNVNREENTPSQVHPAATILSRPGTLHSSLFGVKQAPHPPPYKIESLTPITFLSTIGFMRTRDGRSHHGGLPPSSETG